MKKIILLTITASAAFAAYFVVRNCGFCKEEDHEHNSVKKERHLTDAFSKAKNQV